jgi:hypothetical protein
MVGTWSVGEMKNIYRTLIGKLEGKGPLGNLGVDGMLTFKRPRKRKDLRR